jgi:hypothetical protein
MRRTLARIGLPLALLCGATLSVTLYGWSRERAPLFTALVAADLWFPEERHFLIGLREVHPTLVHLAIYNEVERCAGKFGDLRGTRWAVADHIVGSESRRPAYGVAGSYDSRPMIVIEHPYWMHPAVSSHEVLHTLGFDDGDPIFRCEMRLPESLPLRDTVHSDSLRAWRSRGP